MMMKKLLLTLACGVAGLICSGARGAAEPAAARETLKVAAVQVIAGASGRTPVDDVVHYIGRAAADGARLLVLPEYHLGRIAVPGPETRRVGEAARAAGMHVVVGSIEVLPDGRYFNTALLFDSRGEILGAYRKTHAAVGEPPYFWPARGDELEANMELGTSLPVFATEFGKVGLFTCYDGYFPEVPNVLSLQGAEILIWINGRAGEVEDFMVRTMTYQTYTAVVATNTAHGHGTIVARFPATVLARAEKPETDYITATIDLTDLRRFRKNSRVFHQRRPELYRALGEAHRPWEAYSARP